MFSAAADIFISNILPVFLILAVGYLLAVRFTLDIYTLTKINFYGVTPAFIFASIYTADLPSGMIYILLFILLSYLGNYLAAGLSGRAAGLPKSEHSAHINSVLFYNSGNMGLPVIILVFTGTAFLDQGVAIQIMIIMLGNILVQTLGFSIAWSGTRRRPVSETLRNIFTLPSIYATAAAFLFKLVPADLTLLFFWPAVEYLRAMLIGLALLTFGVQLRNTPKKAAHPVILLPVFIRLIISPLIAVLVISIFPFDPYTSRVLLIGSAMPSAINTALIAVESGNAPDFASQVVLVSTFLSIVTVTGVIALSTVLYPL